MTKLIAYIGCMASTLILVGVMGSYAGTAPNAAYLGLYVEPQPIAVGKVFDVDIMVDTGIVTADTVDAYIAFDPQVLRAISVDVNHKVFKSATYKAIDNTSGRVDLSASVFKAPFLAGAFQAASVKFQAEAPGQVTLHLVRSGARQSEVYSGGDSISPTLRDVSVTVTPRKRGYAFYVPLWCVEG